MQFCYEEFIEFEVANDILAYLIDLMLEPWVMVHTYIMYKFIYYGAMS